MTSPARKRPREVADVLQSPRTPSNPRSAQVAMSPASAAAAPFRVLHASPARAPAGSGDGKEGKDSKESKESEPPISARLRLTPRRMSQYDVKRSAAADGVVAEGKDGLLKFAPVQYKVQSFCGAF